MLLNSNTLTLKTLSPITALKIWVLSNHQSSWTKSVFEVYQDASLPRDWTPILQEVSNEAGVHFFSAPYDFEAVDLLESLEVPAHKIGSGDITWTAIIERLCKSNLPIFISYWSIKFRGCSWGYGCARKNRGFLYA